MMQPLVIKNIKLYITNNFRSIILFPLVGALTAVLYFVLFTFLWYFLHLHYEIAISIAYIVAATFQFFMNRHLTFQSNHHRVFIQIFKYINMVLINYVITIIVVHIVVEWMKFSPPVGAAGAIATTVLSGYLLSRYWVFSRNK